MSLIRKLGKLTNFSSGINRVVIFLTLSDFFILSGWGLVGPIFAVFITEQVAGAGIEVVGLASTIYLLLKSGLQVPLANLIDRIKGEKDDFLAMAIGSLIMSLVPFFYLAVRSVPQLFLVQAFYGIGSALSYPSWLALFTRHIDKNKEGWEWSLYFTITDLSGAAVAAVGAYLAKYLGFNFLFVLVGILNLVGTLTLFKIRDQLRK